MSAEDRNAWAQVARQTLRGIPADLLARGCAKARETCRFASEIVPTIMAEVGSAWERRKKWEAEEREIAANREAALLPPPAYVTGDEAAQILREVREEMARKLKA